MSDPLGILVVCRSFPAHRGGGMEFHAQDVLDGMMQRGHRVHVLTTPLPGKESGHRALQPNGTLSILPHGKPSRYTARSFALLAREAARICSHEGIDVVHAQGFSGIPLGMWGRNLPPVVTTVHGTLWSETPLDRRVRHSRGSVDVLRDAWRFRHRIAFEPLWRAWIGRTPEVVVDSRFTMRELHRINPRLRPRIVPLGVDVARFAGAANGERSRLLARVPRDCVVLLGIGRLERIKGFDLLPGVSAALTEEGVKNVAIIAGEGPDAPRLRRLAHRTRGAHVHFAGRVDGDDLPGLLASADVLLNPDRGWPAFGLANAEALCAGTPVVATPHGAHPEVVSGEDDGILFEVRDPRRWGRAVRMLAERDARDSSRRPARSARACARFSREAMIAGLEEAYRTAIAGKRNSKT